MIVHTLRSGASWWELTRDGAQVEVWQEEGGVASTVLHRFGCPEDAEHFAREAIADELDDGYLPPGPEDLPGALGPELLAQVSDAPGVRERVHAAVFADWDPALLGVTWRGGFVVHLRVRVPAGEVDVRDALTAFLVHPAAWCLETLTLEARDAQGLVDVVVLAGPPPTLRGIAVRSRDGEVDVRRLQALGLHVHERAPPDWAPPEGLVVWDGAPAVELPEVVDPWVPPPQEASSSSGSGDDDDGMPFDEEEDEAFGPTLGWKLTLTDLRGETSRDRWFVQFRQADDETPDLPEDADVDEVPNRWP